MTQTHVQETGVHALLTDGTTVRIRPVRAGDTGSVLRLYEETSAEPPQSRLSQANRAAGIRAAERLFGRTAPAHQALVALHGERLVGVAEYDTAGTPDTAELSLAVTGGFRHRGVGTLLLEHLADAARTAGIRAFAGGILTTDQHLRQLITDLGMAVEQKQEDGEVRCTIALTEGEPYLSAVDRRTGTADRASLRPLLRPRSVAVISAATSPTSVGHTVLRKIHDGGFTGQVYAVNPHVQAILGALCHPSITDLPHPPDLAVLAVPAALVPETAEQCGAAGVGALVVLSAGLDTVQAVRLKSACRHYGMRMVGPDCLGIAVTDEAVRLDATFAPHRPLPGTAGVAVQSGGVGTALLGALTRLGIGVSDFVSLGDKHDVSGNDLLHWWERDGRTTMALLHLESFGNPRAFARTARRVARRIPVLTVDAGRSAVTGSTGSAGSAVSPGSAATPTMSRQALFTQAGIIATGTIGELVDTAALLHAQPLPAGARVAIVSNAGGAAALAAGACGEAGLTVPDLPRELVAELLDILPPGSVPDNPVDATAAVGERALSDCVDRLSAHGAVDAVIVVLAPTALAAATGDNPLQALINTDPDRRPRTVAAVLLDQAEQVRLLHGRQGSTVPAYADPRSAAQALAHAAGRAHWLARPAGAPADTADADPAGARAVVEHFLGEHPAGGWLDPVRCTELLAHYRIPQLPTAFAENENQAVEAAHDLTGGAGRAALKAYWPGLRHKSDQGAVLLDLDGDDAVRAAYRDLAARFRDVMTGVVVQPMAPRGTELVAGVTQDDVFGPLVLFGLGGAATDLLGDRAARLAPLDRADLRDLITSPRCAPLLFGYQAGGPADLYGLERLLAHLSAMACDLPQLAEVDLDPVVARHDGVTAVDVRIRVLPRQPRDPYLRRLR